MADSQDYALALGVFLSSLRAADAPSQGLAWLADEIERELQRAENEARSAWIALHSDTDAEEQIVLSASDQLAIALHVTYHYLVSVPRMWAYVQQFWRTHRQANVVLLDDMGRQVVEVSDEMALHTAETAISVIKDLVAALAEQYGLTLSTQGWLLMENRHDQ